MDEVDFDITRFLNLLSLFFFDCLYRPGRIFVPHPNLKNVEGVIKTLIDKDLIDTRAVTLPCKEYTNRKCKGVIISILYK